MTTMITAPDIECDGCAAGIQKVLGRQDGIQDVTVDLSTKIVTVVFDPDRTSRTQIADILTDIGFPPLEA